jgi:competence protein ComEA
MRTLHRFAASMLALAMIACAQQQRPQPATSAQPTGELLDINTATPQQLNALPGFGPAYTRRVIAGRPYSAKNQLVTRGILPQSAYDRVSPRIVAHRPAR